MKCWDCNSEALEGFWGCGPCMERDLAIQAQRKANDLEIKARVDDLLQRLDNLLEGVK